VVSQRGVAGPRGSKFAAPPIPVAGGGRANLALGCGELTSIERDPAVDWERVNAPPPGGEAVRVRRSDAMVLQ
jgi:hypothetical protein